jgi:hypothetical protein
MNGLLGDTTEPTLLTRFGFEDAANARIVAHLVGLLRRMV